MLFTCFSNMEGRVFKIFIYLRKEFFKFLAVLGLRCCVWAQQLQHTGLVALQHVGYSQPRDRTPVSCIGRWIPNHQTTREVLEKGSLKPKLFVLLIVHISEYFKSYNFLLLMDNIHLGQKPINCNTCIEKSLTLSFPPPYKKL